MRLHVDWPCRRRERHGRGSEGISLLDKAQHRVVLPAGPSPHLAGPDALHPRVTDRAVLVDQNADDEAFIVLPVSCRRAAAFRWHRGSLRNLLYPVAPAVDTSPKERRGAGQHPRGLAGGTIGKLRVAPDARLIESARDVLPEPGDAIQIVIC